MAIPSEPSTLQLRSDTFRDWHRAQTILYDPVIAILACSYGIKLKMLGNLDQSALLCLSTFQWDQCSSAGRVPRL